MLQPDKLKKLNENALKMSEAGKSKEDILAMKDAFIKQFGNEETVKKKVPTEIGTSTSTSQNQKLVSGQADGSLGLPKQQLSQNDLDNLNNLPKQKSRIPELPKNLKKVIDNPENKARFDNLKKQELLKYKQSTSLTDLDAKEVENELVDAKNKNGLLNKAKSAFGSLGNFLTTGAFTETDLLETEKKEAKNKLIQQGIKKPTEEQINKTADELFTKKKIEGRQNDKIASYLENLDPQTKNILGADAEIKYKTLDKEIAKATDRIAMNKIALEDFADALNDPNTLPQDREIIQREIESIAKQIDSDFKYYNSNTDKIGSLKEEFEVFRKNYDTMDNLAMRVGTSIAGAGVNLISATGYLSSLDVSNPISQIRSIQTQEFVNKAKQDIEKTKEGFRPESEELNSENWVNYVTDVLANQSGTLLTLATTGGAGGATLLGVGGAGEKYNEMYNENKKGAGYSPLQMAVTPFLSGASTALLSELPTAKTLMGTKRLFMSAINEGKKEIIDQAVNQTSKKIAKQILDNYKREIPTELLDNLVQNTIDKDILGKDVGYWDNSWKTLKDTAIMTSFFSAGALPHVAVAGVKMFTKPEQNKTLDNNGKKIIELSKQLDNPNLDETSKKVIENQIDKATVENSEIINSTLDKIANLPDEDVKKVVDNNSREEKIKLEAQAVKENETIDPTAKKIVLDGLKKEFTEVREQTKSIIENEQIQTTTAEQKSETQPQAEEQEKVAEVVAEMPNSNKIKTLPELELENKTTLPKIPSGKIFKNEVSILNQIQTKGIDKVIDNSEENNLPIEEVDINLIVPTQKTVNTSNLKKTSEITEETKINEPIILVKEKGKYFVVDGHHRISNDILNGKSTIEAKVFDNEKTSPINTPTNGNVSVGPSSMGEMGIEQKPTAEIVTEESVQSTNDVRPIEGETEVDYALNQIDKGVLTWNGDIMSPRIDLGMSWADIRKGEADLKRGKVDSVPAKRLIESLSNAKKEGGYRYKLGTGGANMRSSEFVSFEDMQRLENEYQLTDSELEEINTNQEQLAKEYDDYINSLDEETQNEILENYEAEIDNTAEIGENTQSGKSEENVSDEKTSRKQQRKKIAEATIDDFANALKDLLPKANTEGVKKQGLSQDDIIDFVAKNAKLLANTGIEIDEAIRQVIAKLKDNFEDLDVNIDDVKAKLEPKVEQEPFERKQGKKSVLTRASQGNSASIKKAIAKYSLDYEIESQEVAKANAEKFVAEVGIEDAFTAVKLNQIPGAEGAFVYAEIIRQINENLETFTDEELIQYEESNMELLGEVTKMLDEKSRSAGRFISALGNIYQSSDGMYNLSIQVKNYKAQNGGTIPADILAKFTEANEKIKELEKQIAEAKKIREEQESVRSIEEIIESISRKNKIDRSKPISDKAKAKAFADKLRSFKTTSKGTLNASTPFSLAFDSAIEIIATSIEAGGKISDAIKQGVDYIRKQNLNKDEENQAIAQVFNAFEESERVQRGIRLDDEGKLRIPHSILREKVEAGITNVDDLVTAIKSDVDELFPDEQFTERQVRDAITQYGKTTNPTKDEIEIEISVMKSLGKLISGMEDAYDGKRPARSGLQRRPLTAEERTQTRKLKELLRDLPMDDADLQRTWKTALDAIKSRLTNEITDLDQQIANGEKRKGEKKAIEYDAEANALKAERDQKRQLLDELVGKPELTEEERINKAEILLEKSIIDLQEKIDAGDIAYKSKPTPLNSQKLKSLREQKKALQQTMEQMRQDAGLAEMKRLQIAKNARIKRIAELKRRLDEKDFSKKERKPLPIDAELAQLEAEAMELKEVYDKEVYKLELKNQTNAQKFGKLLLEVLNIPKILSFTIDMSFIGIQGGIQFYRLVRTNPKKAMTIFTNTVKAMFNAKTENRYANELKSNPNYTLWRKAKLAITEVNYKTSAQEELFQHNIINGTLDALGDKLQEKGYTKLGAFVREYLNFTKIFERGQTYFLNQMRINRFDEGVDILRRQGKNELDDIKEYEKVASAVNTLTGRANTSQSSVLANLRSLNGTLFSSFANWLSVINQLNPYWYATLTPTARKMALSDLFHFVGAVGGFMTLATLASSDDDEPFTIETDPRSSDFMLLKKGNLRIDPWQTKKSHAVFMARMLPYIGGVKNGDGEIVEFGVDRNDKNRLELAWQYMSNKFSPGVSNLIQYTSLTEEKEYGGVTFRENKFGEDYKMSKMFIPLYIQSLKEVAKEQPNAFGKSVSVLNYMGLVNLSIYGDNKGVKDRPDVDESGNKTVKSEKFSYPKPPSPPKPSRP